ncbi:MAG: ABC transporter permease [Rhodospirillaceae bacterium]|nr:ABC transporter permease [Rhodospirillaceae bacterium]
MDNPHNAAALRDAAPPAEAAPSGPSLWYVYRVPLWSLLVLAVFVAVWEWGFRAAGVPPYFIPTLSEVAKETVRAYNQLDLVHHTAITSFEVLLGFVLGAVLGMIMGYVLGMSPTTELVLSPYILALQIAPKVAFAPLFVLWFGFSVEAKMSVAILVAILIVFFPVMVNVLGAVRAVDPAMVNLARTFNATRWQIFSKIEFPASMPALFSGLRIGSTLAVIGVTVGELVGGINRGLGFLLLSGETMGAPLVFLAIIMLTIIGIVAYCAVILVERRVLHYMPRREFGDVGGQGGK